MYEEKEKMPEMDIPENATITLDGVEYNFHELPDNAKHIVLQIEGIRGKIRELQQERQNYDMMYRGYTLSLAEILAAEESTEDSE